MASSRTHKGHEGKGMNTLLLIKYIISILNNSILNNQYYMPLVLLDLGVFFMPIRRRTVGIFL